MSVVVLHMVVVETRTGFLNRHIITTSGFLDFSLSFFFFLSLLLYKTHVGFRAELRYLEKQVSVAFVLQKKGAPYQLCFDRYLRSYEDGLYVYYKEPKENLKEMTCSEAHGK